MFLNLDKGYGYGYVMLESRNSRTEHPDIGISDGEGNGKYWSRHIVSAGPTDLKPGDQFEERTVYVVFRCSKAAPLSEFFDHRTPDPGEVPPASPHRAGTAGSGFRRYPKNRDLDRSRVGRLRP